MPILLTRIANSCRIYPVKEEAEKKVESNLKLSDGKSIFNTQLASSDVEFLQALHIQVQQYGKMMAYYRSALMELETKFNVMNEEFKLLHDREPIVSMSSRVKHPASIKQKLDRLGLPVSIENMEHALHDIAGLRIVCSFLDDVYMLEKAFLSQDDVILINRKDYIDRPKKNGYRSLHLIVQIPIFLVCEKKLMTAEIQLRTIAMDCWATLEHQIQYKKDTATQQELEELRHCAEIGAEMDQRMQTIWKRQQGQIAISYQEENTHAHER